MTNTLITKKSANENNSFSCSESSEFNVLHENRQEKISRFFLKSFRSLIVLFYAKKKNFHFRFYSQYRKNSVRYGTKSRISKNGLRYQK